MADFSALIAQIEAYVKQNGNNEITGNGLQSILVGMVNALGTVAITALQGDLADEVTARTNADGAINAKIPAEASSSNKLADKAFVTGLTTPLQNAVNAINANIENGYVYAGIATPSGTPVSGKVFYLARQAGTYTNFGGLTLTEGVNVLKYNGTAWSQEQLISIADIYRNPLMGYYECDTAGATAAKTVAATGYVLPTTGGSVKIKMANRNSVADATLNINSTGAKPLYYNGQRAGVGNTWDTNEIVVVYYDGTNYQAYNVAGSNGDGVFDISAYNLTDGQPTPYVDLAAALGTNGEHVPQSLRKGGMSIKFIQGSVPSSDNKYIQARCMAQNFTTDVTQWQRIDDGSTALIFSEVAYRFQPSSISFDDTTKTLTFAFTRGAVTLMYKNKFFHITGGTYTLENSKSFVLSTSSEELLFPNLETLASNTDLFLYKTDVLFSYNYIYLFASNIGGSIYSPCGLIENALNNSIIDTTIGDVRNLIQQRIVETNLTFTGVFSASKNAANVLTFTTNNAHGWTKQGKWFLIPNGTYTLEAGDYIVLSESDSEYVRPTLNNITNGTTIYLKTIHQSDLTFDDIPVIINAGGQGVASVGNFIEDELIKAELNVLNTELNTLNAHLNARLAFSEVAYRFLPSSISFDDTTKTLTFTFTRGAVTLMYKNKYFHITGGTYTLENSKSFVLSTSSEELIFPNLETLANNTDLFLYKTDVLFSYDFIYLFASNIGGSIYSPSGLVENALDKSTIASLLNSDFYWTGRFRALKDNNNVVTFTADLMHLWTRNGKWFVIPDGTYTLSSGEYMVLSSSDEELIRPDLENATAHSTFYLKTIAQDNITDNDIRIALNAGAQGVHSICHILEDALLDKLLYDFSVVHASARNITASKDSNNIITFSSTYLRVYAGYGKWFIIPDGTYTVTPGYALVLSATQNSFSRPNLNALNAGTTLYLVSVQQGSAEYNSAVVFVNNVGNMGSYSISNVIEKALFDNGNSQLITGLNQMICKGAKVSVIGDSISTFAGTTPAGYMNYYPNQHASVSDVDEVSDTWWYKVINNLGAELLVNASFSGSGATRITIGGTERLNFYSRANSQVLGNPDIVFVALGTNDSGEQKPIGSEYHYDTPIADLSEDEFCDAYIKGIKSLMEISSIKIIVCVLLKIDNSAYSNAIRTIASHYNLPIIEAGGYANVGAGPHPNAAGMVSIFEFFKNDTSHLELITKSIKNIGLLNT